MDIYCCYYHYPILYKEKEGIIGGGGGGGSSKPSNSFLVNPAATVAAGGWKQTQTITRGDSPPSSVIRVWKTICWASHNLYFYVADFNG